MMRRLLYIGLITACMLTACSDYLEEHPKDRIPEEQAYEDATNLYLNTVAVLYNYIGGYEDSQGLQGTYRGLYDLNTFTTDEAMIPTRGSDWYDGGFWQALFTHDWASSSSIQATWEYLYKVIVLSNRSLEKLEQHAHLLSAEQYEAYTAEVRALRAMYYYYLLDMYGRVPLVLSSNTSMSDVKQSSRSEVFHFVVNELQETLYSLSFERSNYQGDYYGRITMPVSCFLLAKLFLNAEIYTDDNWTDSVIPDVNQPIFNIADDMKVNAWEAVMHYCNMLEALGYQLENNFIDNFSVHNESSRENIFTIPMDPNLYINQMQNLFRSYHYQHAAAYGFGGENGSSATLETLATFGYGTDEEDMRFYWSFYYGPVYDLDGQEVILQSGAPLEYQPTAIRLDLSGSEYEQTAGARMKKYEVDKTAPKDGKLMNNDIVLFRYADVLLMKAEAKVRNGENGDEEMNAVRERAGMNYRPATLENILEERKLELMWEGWRRQDLVRFRQFTRAYSDRPMLENEESGYTTVFPIPGDVVMQNPNITQNYGY